MQMYLKPRSHLHIDGVICFFFFQDVDIFSHTSASFCLSLLLIMLVIVKPSSAVWETAWVLNDTCDYVLKKGIQIVINEFRLSPAGKVKHWLNKKILNKAKIKEYLSQVYKYKISKYLSNRLFVQLRRKSLVSVSRQAWLGNVFFFRFWYVFNMLLWNASRLQV